MSADLRELYQEMILDHGKRPRNFRVVDGPSHEADGYNPLCGDELQLTLRVEDGVIQDIAFQGSGCAISTASASLMTSALKGRRVEEV
ncbi:MAG: SUF system NifU family Fe-S cluster assembly protein, partial [Acidobacteriota bacterium]|nr:SUF system NifU family Fe-S cluster assembly protein [Acidobacteriota bacterium]